MISNKREKLTCLAVFIGFGTLAFCHLWLFTEGLPFFFEDSWWVLRSEFSWKTALKILPTSSESPGGIRDRPVQQLVHSGVRCVFGPSPAVQYTAKGIMLATLVGGSSMALWSITRSKALLALGGILLVWSTPLFFGAKWICDYEILALLFVCAFSLLLFNAVEDCEKRERPFPQPFYFMFLLLIACLASKTKGSTKFIPLFFLLYPALVIKRVARFRMLLATGMLCVVMYLPNILARAPYEQGFSVFRMKPLLLHFFRCFGPVFFVVFTYSIVRAIRDQKNRHSIFFGTWLLANVAFWPTYPYPLERYLCGAVIPFTLGGCIALRAMSSKWNRKAKLGTSAICAVALLFQGVRFFREAKRWRVNAGRHVSFHAVVRHLEDQGNKKPLLYRYHAGVYDVYDHGFRVHCLSHPPSLKIQPVRKGECPEPGDFWTISEDAPAFPGALHFVPRTDTMFARFRELLGKPEFASGELFLEHVSN